MNCKDCDKYEVCKRIDYELEYNNKSLIEAESELPLHCRLYKNKSDSNKVVYGNWKELSGYSVTYRCSICSHIIDQHKTKYCSNCGAKMKGDY